MSAIDHGGRTFLPRTRKTRALMAFLAMAGPKPVLRAHIAALLWSRRENEQARASLRQSVHELQDTLGTAWGHLLVADRHHLALRADALDIDANSLAQPAKVSLETLASFKAVLLEDLNGLDPAFDRWLDQERARFLRIARTVGESLLAKCEDPAVTIETAEQLLAIDRQHEGAWRAIIRAHADCGDTDAALGSYDRCRGVLAECDDGRPSAETEDLVDRVRSRTILPRSREVGTLLPPSVRARERTTLRLRVLPLRTIGEERNDGLGVGLAEEISAGLSRFKWISCLPTTLWPAESTGGFSETGIEADLVIDGTIQRGLGRVRIIARLLDMRIGGEIVWAGRFDRELTDTLALQDELGATIVAQVDPELMQHEGRRTAGTRTHDLTGQDLLLQALPAMYRLERESFLTARRLLELSLQADPASSVAHGWMAYWDLLYVGQGWADDPEATTAEAARLAERAVMLDPGDARALTLAGHVRGFLGKHPNEANALHERAIALNPNLAIAWCFSGLACSYLGDHAEALRRMNIALRLAPSDPHGFFYDTALIMPHLLIGDLGSAIDAGRRAIEINPLFSSAYKGYLSALGLMGERQEVGVILRRLMKLEPTFSVRQAVTRSPLSRPEDVARYAEGLRRAGLREETGLFLAESSGSQIRHSVIDLVPRAPHSPIVGAA
jgi:DNA-binding SARP family transcriptional activator/tetratricopeptide (TPR) repeat protein